uniref:Complex 1 LYR protein domain-containing protein n=1 Tax=Sinocyclocheilus rhinocerous TaxID=307959 RepID=A0A673LLB2_9TELE
FLPVRLPGDLALWQSLLHEPANVKTYALRRVRDAFRENRTVEDPEVVKELLNRARDSLALIQRQVLVQKIDTESYSQEKPICTVW